MVLQNPTTSVPAEPRGEREFAMLHSLLTNQTREPRYRCRSPFNARLKGFPNLKFSIWQLLLLTFLSAIYLVFRAEFRTALVILPMCAGAYAAWSLDNRFSSVFMRMRFAIIPTVLLTLALLTTEVLFETTSSLIAGSGDQQSIALPSVATICFVFAVYTFVGFAGGALVGVAVHCCVLMTDILGLGISAFAFQHEMRANQALNPSRRACPICKTSPTRRLG